MRRFVAVMNIPSPYRVYLFEALSAHLKSIGVAFEAEFMAKGHPGRPKSWLDPKMSFPSRYYTDIGPGCHHFNPALIIKYMFHKPDVMLVGSPFDTFTGILLALFGRAKVKCTWIEGQTKTPGRMGGLVGLFKRCIISRFHFVAVPGEDGARYIAMHQELTRLKMPTPVKLPNLINENRFCPRDQWPAEAIAKIRSLMGAENDEKVCIIPARLEKVKGLVPFMEEVDAGQIQNGWRIVIMGQGSEKDALLRCAKAKGIEGQLSILDYVSYDQMPLCYAAADLFLLPSLRDQNPLSVPEALHSGLPIALTVRAGNVEEGVTEGKNGWVLPVDDRKALADKLRVVFGASIDRLHEMGQFSKQNNAAFWSTSKSIKDFCSRILD